MANVSSMRQVILTFKRGYKFFIAIAASLVINLISIDKFSLCGAVLIGALLAFFYFLSTAARLETAAKIKNVAQAKKIMLIGLLLRLLMISVVLAVAAKISTELFLASSVCFVVFYVSALGVLVYFGRG